MSDAGVFLRKKSPVFLDHNHIPNEMSDPWIFDSLYAALVRKEEYLLGSSEQQANLWLQVESLK